MKVEATGSEETTFDTWPSAGLTERESLQVAVKGVQQTLQKNLCGANKDLQDCTVATTLGTKRRQLDERGRSLQSTSIQTDWTISFTLQCTGACDDELAQAQAAAEAIAALNVQYDSLNSLSNDEYREGYLAALALLPSEPADGAETYWSTVTFDVQQGVISGGAVVDPTLPFNLPEIEAAGYTLVGQGFGIDDAGSYYCYFGWRNTTVSTPEQCATECQGQSTCYGDASLIFRGFDFGYASSATSRTCFCNFDCDHTSTTIPSTCDSFTVTDEWETCTGDNIDGSGPIAESDQEDPNMYAFKVTG